MTFSGPCLEKAANPKPADLEFPKPPHYKIPPPCCNSAGRKGPELTPSKDFLFLYWIQSVSWLQLGDSDFGHNIGIARSSSVCHQLEQ